MDTYFKLPTNYACISRSGENIYAYSSDYRTRDTFELLNWKWIKTQTTTQVNGYNPNTCFPSTMNHLIPSSISGDLFLSAILCCCLLSIGLFKVFKR